MVQIKKERLTDRYCPECGERMQWWGAKKHGMVLCIVKGCDEVIRYEDALAEPKIRRTPLNRSEGLYKHYYED